MEANSIVLGSGSPRRKQLLTELGFQLEIVALDIDESYPSNLASLEVASFVATKKMDALKKLKPHTELLLTADTTVVFSNQILGKPVDEKNAKEMLELLSGQKHIVNTGVELSFNGKTETLSCYTEVQFNQLSPGQIDYYISNFNPFDKAGSYGIQDWFGLIGIKSINGSYTNVVGLPTDETYQAIQRLIQV
jgi:septum formation protein